MCYSVLGTTQKAFVKVTDLGLPAAASGSSDFKALEERGLICLEDSKKRT